MSKSKIEKLIAIARKNVTEQIKGDAGYGAELSERTSMFARGLSAEGFNGGYRTALDDVLLALSGVIP